MERKNLMDSIIFDVDGTLWDATEIIAGAWNNYIHEKEHMEMDIDSEYLSSLFGQLLSDIAKNIFPDLPEEEQLRIIDGCCRAEEEALLKKCAPLYEGLEETLKELSARYPLYIVSNCQAGYIEAFLETSGLGKYFQGHLCPGDTGMGKGKNIMKIVKDHDLKSPVYVGDTMGDCKACQEAGVPFIWAAYGFGEVTNPWKQINKPADLLEICR